MAVGPIQFSVSTNPIDALNARLKALGRKEVITSIKSYPFAGGYNHDVFYINDKGEEWTYGCVQHPTDSYDFIAEKFFAHLGAAEEDFLEQKKSDLAAQHSADYTVWIWGIEYPNARVEYHEGIEQVRSVSGFTHGVYKAGAKTSGVPRTEEPFDIVLKHRNGDVVALHGCSWVADGEVCCTSVVKNGKSSFQPEMSVAAAQQKYGDGKISLQYPYQHVHVSLGQEIPAGAMVNSDGEVVGKATPARAMAYLNGTPIGVLTGIDYSGIAHLNTDAEGRVTTTAQQVKEAIDRSNAISVPTRDEIKRSLLERVANDGSRKASDVVIDLVAESTHETYKAMERLGRDMRAGFEQSRMRFDNLAGQPLTRDGLGHAIGKMRQSFDNAFVPSRSHIPLDFAPAIGDNASVSKPLWPTTHELGRMTVQERTVWNACVEHSLDAAKRGGPAPPQDLVAYFKETTVSGNISKVFSLNNELSDLVKWDGAITSISSKMTVAGRICFVEYMIGNQLHSMDVSNDIDAHQSIASELIRRGHASRKETTVSDTNPSFKNRAAAEAIEVAYRTAAIKLPDLVRKQLVKRMASKGGKRPSQARLSLAEEMLSGDEGSLIVAGILSLALSASPEFIKSKMPWLDLDRLARELRLNVETRIACAVADMLGMYFDGALEALKEAFGGSQQLLLAESSKPDESALFNGVPKAETVGVR